MATVLSSYSRYDSSLKLWLIVKFSRLNLKTIPVQKVKLIYSPQSYSFHWWSSFLQFLVQFQLHVLRHLLLYFAKSTKMKDSMFTKRKLLTKDQNLKNLFLFISTLVRILFKIIENNSQSPLFIANQKFISGLQVTSAPLLSVVNNIQNVSLKWYSIGLTLAMSHSILACGPNFYIFFLNLLR